MPRRTSPGIYIPDLLISSRYPNRPHNHSPTMPFHDLYILLFNPLNENRKKTGPVHARAKTGPHGPTNMSTNEYRRVIVERFVSKWRKDVGNDFYPAMRLIVPEKDRDRAMYGMKERAIGKILVKIMKLDKSSEDAQLLLNWKLPGNTSASRMAGDFAGRCYESISKRPIRTTVGSMSIAEVNELLDRLSVAQKDEQQIPIFETFYRNMNADEMMWLIRIVLRQMKVGATEKTFLNVSTNICLCSTSDRIIIRFGIIKQKHFLMSLPVYEESAGNSGAHNSSSKTNRPVST